ncbi:MAG: hypothetical protein ACYDDF_07300 [Thermoplasmatota archaeon]
MRLTLAAAGMLVAMMPWLSVGVHAQGSPAGGCSWPGAPWGPSPAGGLFGFSGADVVYSTFLSNGSGPWIVRYNLTTHQLARVRLLRDISDSFFANTSGDGVVEPSGRFALVHGYDLYEKGYVVAGCGVHPWPSTFEVDLRTGSIFKVEQGQIQAATPGRFLVGNESGVDEWAWGEPPRFVDRIAFAANAGSSSADEVAAVAPADGPPWKFSIVNLSQPWAAYNLSGQGIYGWGMRGAITGQNAIMLWTMTGGGYDREPWPISQLLIVNRMTMQTTAVELPGAALDVKASDSEIAALTANATYVLPANASWTAGWTWPLPQGAILGQHLAIVPSEPNEVAVLRDGVPATLQPSTGQWGPFSRLPTSAVQAGSYETPNPAAKNGGNGTGWTHPAVPGPGLLEALLSLLLAGMAGRRKEGNPDKNDQFP